MMTSLPSSTIKQGRMKGVNRYQRNHQTEHWMMMILLHLCLGMKTYQLREIQKLALRNFWNSPNLKPPNLNNQVGTKITLKASSKGININIIIPNMLKTIQGLFSIMPILIMHMLATLSIIIYLICNSKNHNQFNKLKAPNNLRLIKISPWIEAYLICIFMLINLYSKSNNGKEFLKLFSENYKTAVYCLISSWDFEKAW